MQVTEKDKLNWYTKSVMFEMVKQMNHREVAFLGTDINVRCIRAPNFSFFMKHILNFKAFRRDINIYYSVAHLKEFPYQFSFNPVIRKQQQNYFKKVFKDYIIGHDTVFDFDSHIGKGKGKTNKAYDEFKDVVDLLDLYNVPYSPRFSGSGFHVVIPFECYPSGVDWINFGKEFLKGIRTIMDLSSLDTSTSEFRSLLKLPYSLDVKTGNVCLPLTKKQINNFDESDMKWKNIKSDIIIRDRGILMRPGNIGNLNKFCKEILSW